MALVPIIENPWNPVTLNVRFADHTLRVKSAVEMDSYDNMEQLKVSIFEKLQPVAKARKVGEWNNSLFYMDLLNMKIKI